MRTKGEGGETQQLCTSHTHEASLEAALKWGERTSFHQKQTQPIPTTSKDRKLPAPTRNNFSISALRSPYFVYILRQMKTFILKTPVQLNIHHARKAQSCSCSGQGSCWAQTSLEGRGASTGTYQPLVWEPQQRLLLTPFCSTTSLACAPPRFH